MKKIVALLTAVLMVLGCVPGLAENTKHERVYVVTAADGTIKSITDSLNCTFLIITTCYVFIHRYMI